MHEISELGKLLSKFFPHFDLIGFNIKNLTEPGENYGSVMLQIEVKLKSDENKEGEKFLRLVAKLCPPNAILQKAFLTKITFKKETFMYLKSIPSIEDFEDKNKVRDRLQIFPKCFGARMNLGDKDDVDENAVILLENLQIPGYATEDRMIGFDFEQTNLVLKQLARFHGTTLAMKLKNPESFENNIQPALVTVNVGSVMVEGFCNVALFFVKEILELHPFLEKLEEKINVGKRIRGLKFPYESNKDFYTMIHTDFWTNNILIAKRNGCTTAVKFIDFQILDYGSIIRDLLFFLYSSVSVDVLNNYIDDFIKYYYDYLIITLNNYSCDVENKYTWDKFEEELNSVAPHELFHIIFMLKPIYSRKGTVEKIDDIDFKEFERTDNVGSEYKKKLKQVLFSYSEKKWI